MPRVRFRNFQKGWWPQGARDQVPQGTLRRSTGIAQTKTTALQSRWGSESLQTLDAHSVHRYNLMYFAGVGTDYYASTADPWVVIKSGLDGTKLTMARMAPTFDKVDWAFVAGGGLLFKVSPSGVASQWGIDPPPDGFTASLATRRSVVIDAMDSQATWTGSSMTLADEGTIKQEGTNSMKMTVAANAYGTATKSITVDLSTYTSPTLASPDEDFIEFWFRAAVPEAMRLLQIQFSLGGTTFATDYFTRVLYVSPEVVPTSQTAKTTSGIASVSTWLNDGNEEIILVQANEVITGGLGQLGGTGPAIGPMADLPNWPYSIEEYTNLQNKMGQTSVFTAHDQWTRMRVPKATFQRSGTGAFGWDDVQAVRIGIQAADSEVVAYIDDLKLAGGVGMQGIYKYHVIFRNSESGSRSNPNPTPVTIGNVDRQAVSLANLPLSSDSQVDQREIYRTVGNGVLFFRVGVIEDNTTTTFTDDAADFVGLDSSTDNLISSIQLEFDNDRPTDSWDDCEAMYAGRMWWCRSPLDGERGRVFYSPAGRAEAVESWIDVSSDDDPTQKVIAWNGALYCFTSSTLYQIIGTGPFTFRKVFGVPGTLWPLTVKGTPYGIAYLAHDGVRLFNGAASKLIAPEACGLIFKQETLEGVTFSED